MRNVYELPIPRRRRASVFAVVGVVAVGALFASMAWTTYQASVFARGGHLGALDGVTELALATIAMLAIYGLARVLVFEPQAERAKELRR